jgi:hypothetical protein
MLILCMYLPSSRFSAQTSTITFPSVLSDVFSRWFVIELRAAEEMEEEEETVSEAGPVEAGTVLGAEDDDDDDDDAAADAADDETLAVGVGLVVLV